MFFPSALEKEPAVCYHYRIRYKELICLKRTFKLLCGAMSVLFLFSAFSPACFAAAETDYTIVDPYAEVDWDTFRQYKANLHTHSTFSDGEFTLPVMVDKYYNWGYDILAMTDHGVINYGWNLPHNTFPPFCWANHVEGHPLSKKYHTERNMSDVEYTYYTTGMGRGGRGMVDVTGGIELNMAVVAKTHVNGFFLEKGSYGEGVWGVENDYYDVVEGIEHDGKEGYTVLNHVGDWLNSGKYPERAHDPVNIAYLANLFVNNPSCLGMEIVNGPDRVTRRDRELWDELLQVVLPHGRTIIGFTNDDSETDAEMGHAFEMFPLSENTFDNVKHAMLTGAFFGCARCDNSDPDHPIDGPKGADEQVPLVKSVTVDQQANTITVTVDDSRPCRSVSWIADGKVIQTDTDLENNTATIDLNDYEDALGCYVRFTLSSENGVCYSQAYALQYAGRTEKPIPDEALAKFRTPLGKLLVRFIHTHFFTIIRRLWESRH